MLTQRLRNVLSQKNGSHGASSRSNDPSLGTEQRTKQIEAQQIYLLYTQATSGLVGTVINAGIVSFTLWNVVSHFRLLVWLVFIEALTAVRWFFVQWRRRSTHPEQQIARWRSLLLIGAGVSGLAWGAAGFFLFPETSQVHQVFLAFMVGGLTAGAVAVLAASKAVYLAFVLPMVLPFLLRLSLSGGELSSTMIFLLLFFTGICLSTANHMHASIVESLRLRFDNFDLIQDLCEAKERAEQNEQRFRSLIEHASDLITILSADGVICYNSPSLRRLLGYEAEEYVGRQTSIFLHPEDTGTVEALFAALLREPSKVQTLECRIRHKDGSWRMFESSVQNLLDDPAVAGVVFNSRDITERKEIECLKDDLVSTVSHELRTPLTSLRGFAELMLAREFPPAKQRHFLSIILGEATRLTNLINDFLDLQRIESGRQTYAFAAVNLPALLQESFSLFAPTDGKHTVRFEVADSLPLVHADADRLRQVLANLLSNALKFSPHGGTVTLAAFQQVDQVIVRVTDEGVGISSDGIARLFQKFYRVDNTETRSIGGTGLGLALVKQIIEAHRGQVWVDSTIGRGSSFFFSLPLASPATPSQEPETMLL